MKKKILNDIYKTLEKAEELKKIKMSMYIISYYDELEEYLLNKNNIPSWFWHDYETFRKNNLKLINFNVAEGIEDFTNRAIQINENIKRFGIKKFTIRGPEDNQRKVKEKLIELGCKVRGTETIKIYRRKIFATRMAA